MQNDRIVRATGAKSPFRLVAVDLTLAAREIGKRHQAKSYPLKLLAETAIASVFLSSSLKFPGSVNFKINFDGDISVIQADSTPQGLVRAMIPQHELLRMNQNNPQIAPKNITVIKRDEHGKRAQESVTEAVAGTVGQNLATYLLNSEQVRSAVGIEARVNADDSSKLDYAVGFMIEAYPDLSERDLAILEQVVLNFGAMQDYFKEDAYDLDALIDQLRGPYDIDIVKELTPAFYCPCSHERMLNSLATLPKSDLQELAREQKPLELVCDFCQNKYDILPDELNQILIGKSSVN